MTADGARVVSIGPVTSATARELGLGSTSRPSATTSTAWSTPLLADARARAMAAPVIVTLLTDYGRTTSSSASATA